MNMMKLLLTGVAAALISLPAMAANSKGCENAKDIGKCLEQASSPESVRQAELNARQARCNQNAQNQNLQGNARSSYLSSCMNENEAAQAAKASAAGQPAPAPHAAPVRTHQASAKPAAKKGNSCVAQANKQHLRGKKRQEFLHNCKA